MQHYSYDEIETLYQVEHNFFVDGSFKYNGTYNPGQPLPSQHYRLKLEIMGPHGIKEKEQYQFFHCDRSGFNVKLEEVEKNGVKVERLIPGESYTIPVKIKNNSQTNNYNVKNGKCNIVLRSHNNQEIFRKEITNICVASGEEIERLETFVFSPVETGRYILYYEYTDETMEEDSYFTGVVQSFLYRTSIGIIPDKKIYKYLDNASVGINIFGAGNYHIHFACPEAGIDEERMVQIPGGSFSITEVFQIPIGVNPKYNINVEVKDAVGKTFSKSAILYAEPLEFDYTGKFSEIFARAGSDVHLDMNIKDVSGMTQPLTGQLFITCPQLNYQDIKTVTIQPFTDNPLTETIPIATNVSDGIYRFDVTFTIEAVEFINKYHLIYLPKGNLKFLLTGTGTTYNAGDTLTLDVENIGGKAGHFETRILLKDSYNNVVTDNLEILELEAGEGTSLSVLLPLILKNGRYHLVLEVNETLTQSVTRTLFPIFVNGLTASLNSYTLKEKYFDNENVSGKSEITSGNGNIGNGFLRAKIIRYLESSGIEEEKPGDYISTNMIEEGFSSDTKLYLSTDKGLLEYDKASGNINLLTSFKNDNCRNIYQTAGGEIWVGTTGGVFRRDSTGTWQPYTTANGLTDNWINDIIEADLSGTSAIWVATRGGISVFSSGNWTSFTTVNGLPSDWVYALASDDTGAVWASTSGGVVRQNGTTFESVSAPFGTASVSGNLTSTIDGSVWMVYSNTVYRYHSGVWDTWTRDDLYPDNTIYIRQIEAIGENVWIKSDFWEGDNKHQVLIRYDGVFTIFTNTEVQGLTGLDYYAIMPGNGDDAYFTCEFGFMEYKGGTWSDKEIAVDKEKLAGEILSMKVDSNGTIWAGTDYGLSMYDGGKWINFVSTPGNLLLLDVTHMTIDTSNRIYGFNLDGVIKISNGALEMIPFTTELYNLGFGNYNDTRIAVDSSGKVWLGRTYTFYYDGAWQKYEGVKYVSAMENDRVSGIWVGSWNDYSEFHLQHIKNDLTLDDYTASNSDIIPWGKDRLYMDSFGILWLKDETNNDLQSFDGQTWVNVTEYEGFPQNGVIDFIRDGNGKLVVVGSDSHLYTLENNTFIPGKEAVHYNNSLVYSNGQFHYAGGEPIYVGGEGGYIYPRNFVTLGSTGGLTEEEVWSQTYTLNLSPGESTDLDLLTGKNLSVGSYVLKTALVSSLDQELAESSYTFHVREDGISVTLSRENGGNPYIKTGSTLNAAVEILNNTPDDYTNLRYLLTKQSPSGTAVTVRDLTLSVAAGGSYTDTVTFGESEIGTWRLTAGIIDESSSGGEEPMDSGKPMLLMEGEGGEGSGTLLSQSEIILCVTEPSVSMEIQSPQFVGDDPFDIKVKLINDGNIGLVVNSQWSVVSDGEIKLDETITLNPNEERLLTFDDTITSDRSYTFTLSGDVEKSETITVQYGYVENFTINVLPSYREGTVTIGYTIANGGGLAFSDDLYFELYTIGGTVPLVTIDRNYNLYPGESPITDAIAFPLTPGNYRLKYRTSKNPTDQESPFTVQPAGIGTVSFAGSLYPVGMNEISYQITNSDTVAGQIPVTVTITNTNPTPTTFKTTADTDTDIETQRALPILSETRYYYLEPGQTQEDYVRYEFIQKGNYTLTFTGSKLTTPVNSDIQILNLDEVSANLSVDTPQGSQVPVTADITNSGYNAFSGTIVMEIDGIRSEETIDVPTASSFNKTFGFQTAALLPGTKAVNVFLYDVSGNTISQAAVNLVINSADIKVIEVPENLEIDAGGYADVTLKLKNEGHLRGDAILKLTALESLFQEREIALEPGEEIEIENIYIEAPEDLPTGFYPFNHTLTGPGVKNGLKAGTFNFKVNGISLDVDASFGSDYYNVGETAELTINVTTQSPTNAPLEAMVNWGEYSEKQTFDLSTGSQQLVFNIPVDAYREDKVFYGIYHEGGKGIHLNDIYLRFGGDIYMVLDQQVYQPGDIVHAVFTSIESGELTAASFDEIHTVPVSSSVMVDFAVPETTLGGTYGVSWAFTPSDTSHEPLSGSIHFDVSGLVVKVAHSGLEKGKYGPGETITANFTFESNMDETLALRCWTITPIGEWEYLGEISVTVSAERHVNAVLSSTFNTTEAGTHNLVYALYREDQLVVSGTMAFDVGDAVLIGVTTDHFEYKEGNETVNVKIDYFGEGTAQLQMYLDDEKIEERSLTISGVGSTEIPLTSTQVSGGSHSLKVVLTKDGLTSTKSTGFIYGTHLPDLRVTFTESESEGLDYTYTIEVTNGGKTASSATSLVFMDNETAVETVSIPALQSGVSHETTFNWSGSGKAGSHEFVFEVDNNNTVKEFSETNNSLTFTEEVPVVFYTLEVEPVIWPANSDITIITRLINNQNTLIPMVLNLSIANDSSGEVIFERVLTEEMPAFGNKTISDIFNTGVYPAGEYTLSQTLSSDTVDLERSINILIETTKAVETTLAIQPQTITADIDVDVELTMTLTNAGNVPLEDETLIIEVFNKDNEDIVKSEEMVFSIPLAEQITETKIMTLNLVEGNYEIRLKYLDELLTAADLIAAVAIEGQKEIAIQPRALVMNLHLFGKRSGQVQFLTGLLQSQEIEHETGHRILDSYVKLHKGRSNVNIVLGNLMGRNLGNELRERVWRGEGLILVCDKPINSPNLADFLGVKVWPIKGKDREKHITLLPGELSSGGEVELEKKNRLMIKKVSEDVIIVGQTRQKKHPVLAWRTYGNGHVLIMTVPLQFKAGIGEISQLLLNAVNHFSKDVYSSSDLTRILPIKLSITNKASEEKSLVVKELLPYGVDGYGYDPEPEKGENEEENLKWNLDVPASGEVQISYWLKLPDQINIYDIKTEIYEGETLRDELSLTVEVSQTVLSRIDELIVEIESMNAAGSDARFLRKAVNKLQNIRNRIGDNLSHVLVNLLDSVEAASNLGSVKTIDVSSQRLKTQNIMIILGRRFYEKVTTWGTSKLIPFTRMITGA